MQGIFQGIAGFNVDVEPLQLEFKTHLAPSLTPLFARDAANMMINTIEKSAISHFLFSYFPIPPFSHTCAEVLSLLASATIHAVEKEPKERSIWQIH